MKSHMKKGKTLKGLFLSLNKLSLLMIIIEIVNVMVLSYIFFYVDIPKHITGMVSFIYVMLFSFTLSIYSGSKKILKEYDKYPRE